MEPKQFASSLSIDAALVAEAALTGLMLCSGQREAALITA